MKAKHISIRKIIYERGQSFKLDTESLLAASLHCHKAYELVYIRNGCGKEFIGDSVRDYTPGDLVLIGVNLPHLYLSASKDQDNSCDILQFPEDIFPQQMDKIPEYHSICELLHQSSRGLIFTSEKLKEGTIHALDSMKNKRGIDRLILLLQLLNKLSNNGQYKFLSSLGYTSPLKECITNDPVGKIYDYLINNHRHSNVSIRDISEYAKMNPNSICRYFKQKTGKTIFQCLAEIRVEFACKLLGSTDLTISQIAYDSGFGNQGHFNKQFKTVTGQTPSEYRRQRNDNME